MVHKVFTNQNGDELSIRINNENQLFIRIENRITRKDSYMILESEEANELSDELIELIDIINEKDGEPF
jgi:hypothetical protein